MNDTAMETSTTSSVRHSKRRKTQPAQKIVSARNRTHHAILPDKARELSNECFETYLKNYRAKGSTRRWTRNFKENSTCEYYFGPKEDAVNDFTYFTDTTLAKEVGIKRKGEDHRESDRDDDDEDEDYDIDKDAVEAIMIRAAEFSGIDVAAVGATIPQVATSNNRALTLRRSKDGMPRRDAAESVVPPPPDGATTQSLKPAATTMPPAGAGAGGRQQLTPPALKAPPVAARAAVPPQLTAATTVPPQTAAAPVTPPHAVGVVAAPGGIARDTMGAAVGNNTNTNTANGTAVASANATTRNNENRMRFRNVVRSFPQRFRAIRDLLENDYEYKYVFPPYTTFVSAVERQLYNEVFDDLSMLERVCQLEEWLGIGRNGVDVTE